MRFRTGMGYITDKQGNLISFFDLPIGEHPADKSLIYVEVDDPSELNTVRDRDLLKKHNSIMKNQRAALFSSEYSVLESKYLRDEATKEELILKAAEIRNKYPYLEEINEITDNLLKKFPYLKYHKLP